MLLGEQSTRRAGWDPTRFK